MAGFEKCKLLTGEDRQAYIKRRLGENASVAAITIALPMGLDRLLRDGVTPREHIHDRPLRDRKGAWGSLKFAHFARL